MSATLCTGYERLTPALAERIDEVCDRFEQAWRAGERPAIESYLAGTPAAERAVLLRELILVEAPYRKRAGDDPQSDDYRERFPDLDCTWLTAAISVVGTHTLLGAALAVPPAKLPGYEILGELGRGGMGIVYKARQTKLNRLVALKMILTGSATKAADFARFQAEAEAVAQLQHPNIVQVYEVGSAEGHPYLALEYVSGGTLADALAHAAAPPDQAAELLRTLALAAHHAHERGIIHRDLKPANILLQISDSGLRIADSQTPAQSAIRIPQSAIPKITDFGLVKRLDEDSSHTTTGTVLGTPCYMAPEQTGATGRQVGPASDVYSLGAILYHALTGRPPFQGGSALEILEQVKDRDPVPPSALQPGVPRDLETICLKCLRKEPAKRYASARAMADDLGRFLAGEPIHARPVGAAERALLWARRRPAVAALLVLVTLTAAVGFPAATWLWQRAESALEREQTARAEAEAELNAKRIALARRLWTEGNLPEARRYLDETAPAFRNAEWHYVWRACNAEKLVHKDHRMGVTQLAWSQDSRHMVSRDGTGQVRIWDATTGRMLGTFAEARGSNVWLGFTHRGKSLISASNDPTLPDSQQHVLVKVRNAANGEEVSRCRIDGACNRAEFSPDGTLVLFGAAVRFVDATTGADVFTLQKRPEQALVAAAWSADSRHVAVILQEGSGKTDVRLLEFTPAGVHERSAVIPDSQLITYQLPALSPDGRRLAWANHEDQEKMRPNIHVWDLAAGRRVLDFHAHTHQVTQVAFSPDGRRLATASDDRTAVLWDADTGKESLVLRGHALGLYWLVFSPDGRRLATTGKDGTVRVWDVAVPGS